MSNETEQTQSYCDGSELADTRKQIKVTALLSIVGTEANTLPLQKHLIRETLNNLGAIECGGFYGVDLRITSINDEFTICGVEGLLSAQREIDFISIQPVEMWINNDPNMKILALDENNNLKMRAGVTLKPHHAILSSKEETDKVWVEPPVVKVTDELLFIGGEIENKLIGIKIAIANALKHESIEPFYSTDRSFKVTIAPVDIVEVQDNTNTLPFTVPVKVHAFKEGLEWQGKGTHYITSAYLNIDGNPTYTLKCFTVDERKDYDDFYKQYNAQQELLKSLRESK